MVSGSGIGICGGGGALVGEGSVVAVGSGVDAGVSVGTSVGIGVAVTGGIAVGVEDAANRLHASKMNETNIQNTILLFINLQTSIANH